MKRKIIAITILSIVTGLILINIINEQDVVMEENEKQITNSNMLTMMLETEAGTGNYEEVKQSEWPQDGYVFNASLSRCENGGTLSWNDVAKKVIMESNSSDKCYIYFNLEPKILLTEYIINEVYTTDGENGLYYHDGVGSYTNATEEAGDNSYRYSGANPNNYVCFGSDAATCPNDNLYRIIGFFDDDKDGIYNTKLIKYDYITSEMLGTNGRDYAGTYSSHTSYYMGNMNTSNIAEYRWNYDTSVSNRGSNDWTTSELNKINLNTNYIKYLNSIDEKWVDMIATTTWHLGGMTSYSNTAKEFYEGERNNTGYGDNPTLYSGEIGLMYVSDYGYAAAPSNWITDLNDYASGIARFNNWMYMGLVEWTLNPYFDSNNGVFNLDDLGDLDHTGANTGYGVRPAFYLESSVVLTGGTGASSDPYRIQI